MRPSERLAERLTRPQRIGVFGHHGVGKTTLLTMLYREAVGGRLPGLRLAAADARTANHLSDKILQLEAGQPLPGTLGETDLRFHLYHHGVRQELLFKDYQGEHVELGREEPISEFLRDCDAVWLCVDAGTLSDPAVRLRREQEIEQLVEQYLATAPVAALHRPMALVLTKADLLDPSAGDAVDVAVRSLGMTVHALREHCPEHGCLAVSSLGRDWPAALRPCGLEAPLLWLTAALRAYDAARLAWLWAHAADELPLLEKCVGIFCRRYPDAPEGRAYQEKLRQLAQSRRRRRGLLGVGAAACLVLALASYDVMGRQNAVRFEAEHGDDPAAVLARWQAYQAWHPTRGLFQPSATRDEESHLRELAEQVRTREREARLAELRRAGSDPDADPEAVWQQFVAFHSDFPEVDIDGDLAQLRASVKARRDGQVARRAQLAYDALVSAEQSTADLPVLLAQTDRFLRDHAGSPQEAEVRRRRDAYLRRLDERDIETARAYSAREPLNFQTRREHYQRYLDRHPDGAFRQEAEYALKAIEAAWDRHDFRTVRDHFITRPGDIPELVARCRSYLAVHPQGQFTEPANELLRWSERVTAVGEYKVVLKSGHFDKSVARWLSRGPDLSVELEVAGVRYGPSHIVANSYTPEWYYEFSRPVKWKLGDPVRIRVTDHDWKDRVVVDITSPEGDPLGMRLLAGEVWSGNNRLTFESDFAMPNVPTIE